MRTVKLPLLVPTGNGCTESFAAAVYASGSESRLGDGHHLHSHARRLVVSGSGAGSVLAASDRLVDTLTH